MPKQSKDNLIVSKGAKKTEYRAAGPEFFKDWIGKQVYKHTSLNPFRSGLLKNTVKSLTTNENTGLPAFTFYEDESVVDCWICKIVS